tara:strand:- start:615 stop:911 length:297 start_codon:yes stop_codon:yes gene_type:complete
MSARTEDYRNRLWSAVQKGTDRPVAVSDRAIVNAFLDAWWDTNQKTYNIFHSLYAAGAKRMIVELIRDQHSQANEDKRYPQMVAHIYTKASESYVRGM